MPNVLLNQTCNRNCPYCFARKKLIMDGLPPKNIEFDDVVYILDFLDKTNEKVISYLGGEPTLHPQFADILRYTLSRDFRITVFTNGMIEEPVLEEILKIREDFDIAEGMLRFVVNTNEAEIRTEEENMMQRRAWKALGDMAMISFNIFRVDHDYSFILDIINEYGLFKQVRLGLAAPVVGADTESMSPKDYENVLTRLTDFSDECDESDVKLGFDCGFVMCKLTDEQLGRLFRNSTGLSFGCGPAIDIGPDLSVWNCFPLVDEETLYLKDYDNLQQLHEEFMKRYETELKTMGVYEECADCKYLKRGLCMGGCMAHYRVSAPAPKKSKPGKAKG